jgi:two-component system NtrC family response regulator
MSLELPRMGHEVTVCPDGLTAVAALERNTYDCILVDLDMPGLSGIEVIARAKEFSPDTEAVVLTGKSSLETAVAALRQGAFDYLTKPCKLVELDALLRRVAAKRELTNKYRALKRQLERIEGKSHLVGGTASMEKVRKLIAKVAPTNSTVLILGETGTGKELVARAVHDQSLRAEMPFVAINCGALPESLIESELFGHRKGAFTGADEHRVGLFEVANGGTLFLDEIGELPKAMQAKLLRFLESGEIRRVGENQSFVVDVRVVCATHRHLEEMVHSDEFREDLMFRINTFEIHLPPLRERVEDIPSLARHLLQRFRPAARPQDELFTPEALEALKSHVWPGNVRELANVIEHAAIVCDEGPIAEAHLPRRFSERRLRTPQLRTFGAGLSLREIELQAIQQSLDRHNGNKPKAAEELGISLKTLYNKLNQFGTLEQSA